MREAATQRSARRVVGPAALVKSLRSLLRRAHRFSEQRARSRDELIWAARFVDGLRALLRDVDRDAMTMARATTDAPTGALAVGSPLNGDGRDA